MTKHSKDRDVKQRRGPLPSPPIYKRLSDVDALRVRNVSADERQDLEDLLRDREAMLRRAMEPPPPPDDLGITVHGGFQFERDHTAIWWRLVGAFMGGLVIGLAVGKHLL